MEHSNGRRVRSAGSAASFPQGIPSSRAITAVAPHTLARTLRLDAALNDTSYSVEVIRYCITFVASVVSF